MNEVIKNVSITKSLFIPGNLKSNDKNNKINDTINENIDNKPVECAILSYTPFLILCINKSKTINKGVYFKQL